MDIYVKISLIYIFSHFYWFSIMIDFVIYIDFTNVVVVASNTATDDVIN